MAISKNQPMRPALIDSIDAINDEISDAIDDIEGEIGSGFSSENTIADAIGNIESEIGSGFSSANTIAFVISGIENDIDDIEAEIGSGFSSENTIASKLASVSTTTISNIAVAAPDITIVTARYAETAGIASLYIKFKATSSLSGGFKIFDVVSGKRPALLVYGTHNASWASYFSLNNEGGCYTAGTPTTNTEYIVTFTYVKL